MAYLGNNTDHNAEVFKTTKDRFSGNGSATAFTLSAVPANAESMQVFVNNVRQDSGRAYTVSGTTLTFTEAPSSATGNIYVVFNSVIAGISQVITANTQLRTGVVTQHAMSNTAFYSMGELLVGGKIHLDNAGHVGIGTISPTTFSGYTSLHHHNTGGDAIHLIQSDGGIIAQTIVNDASSAVTHGARSNHAYRITTNDTERLRITTAGDVGIGATPSYAKLQITGGAGSLPSETVSGATMLQLQNNSSTSDNTRLSIISGTAGQGNIDFGDSGDEDQGAVYYNHSTSLMGFRTSGSGVDLIIDSAGKVGIGSTSPAALLHVEGTGKFVTGTDTNGFIISENANNDQAIVMGVSGGSGSGTAYIKAFSGSANESLDLVFQTASSGTEGTAFTLRANNSAEFASHFSAPAAGSQFLIGHSSYVNTGTNAYSQIHYANKGNTLLLGEWSSTNASYPALRMLKSASSTIGTNAIVADGEHLGAIEFNAADGVDYISVAAAIRAYVNGTPGDSDMPGALTFDTTADGSAGTSERVRITSAGKVGIGTTTPSETLELQRVSGKIGFGMNSDYGVRIGYFDDGSGVHGFHVDTKHAGTIVSESRLVVRADSGKVGIGTKAPTQILDINGTLNIGDGNARLNIHADGTDAEINYLNNAAMVFKTNNSEAARFDVNGKLVIGTTSASGWLHTSASNNNRAFHSSSTQTTVDSTQYHNYIDHNTTFSGTAVPTADRVSYGLILDSDFSGTFAATTTSGQRFHNRAAYITASASHSTGVLYQNDGLLVQTLDQGTGSATVDRLYGIQNYTYDYNDGAKTSNIASINGAFKRAEATGTTTNLYGASNYAYIYASAGPTTNAYGSASYVANYSSSTTTTAAAVRGYLTGDAGTITTGYGGFFNNYFTGTLGASFGIYTQSFERESFSGNVGIKTTSPAVELHISSPQPEIRIQDSDGTNQYGQMYQAGGITYFLTRNNTSNGQYYWNLYDGTTLSTKMIMNTSGNVGIGTTSPASKLHVAGDITSTGNYIKVGDGNAAGGAYDSVLWLLGDSSSGFKIGVNAANSLLSIDREYNGWQNYQLTMLRSNGNIGIGTSAPSEKLHVVDGAGSDAEMILETSTNNTGARIHLKSPNATGANYHTIGSFNASTANWRIGGSGTAGAIDFQVGSGYTQIMRVNSSGAEVTGYMDADNFKVNGAQGSDGQVLTSTGSGVAWEDAGGGGFNSVQVFTSSGTWTKPSGVTKVWVRVVGGGGGGGGATDRVGAGGGGGGYSEQVINVSSISSETVTIGAGGAGGANASSGSAGGTSSFGSHNTATGGGGGQGNGTGPDPGLGGSGTVQSSGGNYLGPGLAVTGGDSVTTSRSNASNEGHGGTGGDSVLGGGGHGAKSKNENPQPGNNYGGGGGGAMRQMSSWDAEGRTGGAGAGGVVIVMEYL